MNLDMIRPKRKTKKLLLSIPENCETPIEQTHTKPEGTLEFKLTQANKILSIKPPVQIEGSWMIGLTSLELYNSFFNITEENNKFELFTDNFDEFSLAELKNEFDEFLSISDNTPSHLQRETKGPRNIQAYKKLRSAKSSIDGCLILIMGYAPSPFRGFESYPRSVVGSDEDDIQLILKQYISNFVTYEIPPSIYSIKDISEVVYTMGDHEGTKKMNMMILA